MKVLFLFTGGTIGSSARSGFIGPDAQKPYLLIEAYRRRYGIDFDYEVKEPYTALSENNTGKTLSCLIACVGEALEGELDGIVVTHGTDTLQYSAAALAYAFADTQIPICLVSGNAPIEQEGANGLANLHGALRFIAEAGMPGVFVPYQNSGEPIRIHAATRLLASTAYTDRLESTENGHCGHLDGEGAFVANPAYRTAPNAMQGFGRVSLEPHCNAILRLEPYPGMRYPVITDEVRYILHGSFHSGTVNTEDAQARAFYREAAARGIPVFMTGAAVGTSYESTRAFEGLGITPLHHPAPIAAFVKLWMWHATHPDENATGEMLQSPLAQDTPL